MADISLIALTGNRETAARAWGAQSADWQRLVWGRRGIPEATHQLSEPYQQPITRGLRGQLKEFEARATEDGERRSLAREFQNKKGIGAKAGTRKKGDLLQGGGREDARDSTLPTRGDIAITKRRKPAEVAHSGE